MTYFIKLKIHKNLYTIYQSSFVEMLKVKFNKFDSLFKSDKDVIYY
jgi:hypothetical protein